LVEKFCWDKVLGRMAERFNGTVTAAVDVHTSILVSGPGALWA